MANSTIQLVTSSGGYVSVRAVDNGDGTFSIGESVVGTVAVSSATPTAANILNGYLNFTNSTAATTIITIPAGRTWIGEIGASCSAGEVAAGTAIPSARAVFTTAGTGVTPAAGTVFVVDARSGANAATGTASSGAQNFGKARLVVVAPAGNSVTVQVTSTNSGTSSEVDAYAIGELQ